MYALMSYDIATGHIQTVTTFCDKKDADTLCAKECCNSQTTFFVTEVEVESRQAPKSNIVHGSKNGKSVLCVGVLYSRTSPVDAPVNCPRCMANNLPF